MWLHSLKVAQLLRSAACLHTNQSRSYLNHLVNIIIIIVVIIIIIIIIIKTSLDLAGRFTSPSCPYIIQHTKIQSSVSRMFHLFNPLECSGNHMYHTVSFFFRFVVGTIHLVFHTRGC